MKNTTAMKEYVRMKLWGVSFWKPLFKEELITLLNSCNPDEYFEWMLYCYSKYSDLHPEILSEAFSGYKNYLNRQITVKV